MTYQDIIADEAISTYIRAEDEALSALGYTEHGFIHVTYAAQKAGKILKARNFPERTVELAKIAGYMHDIGNIVNRFEHSQSGAVMAFRILDKLGFAPDEIAMVVSAIGNHDEGTGVPVSPLAAALILADKSDVRRSRVRQSDPASFDIHDRVNYSVEKNELVFSEDNSVVTLRLHIDTQYCSVMDFFEIFMDRMLLCRKAAEKLDMRFCLEINGQSLI